MHNELHVGIEPHAPTETWYWAIPVIGPLVSAYRQEGGRYRMLEIKHPWFLRVPLAVGTPATVWHWCLMRSLPA